MVFKKSTKIFKKEKTRGKYQPVVVDDVRAEVRIFRSTIIRRNFIKNVEFCEAVRFFCKECEDSDVLNEEIATEKFLKFAEREKEQYPHLYKFLVKYDLIK